MPKEEYTHLPALLRRFRAYCATCASPMLYDELLAEPLRQPLTYEACEKVIRAAGCISNNDAHRSRRIGLRPRNQRQGGKRDSARGQMQKFAAGKFHFEPAFTSFDHLVGAGEERRRHVEAERARGLQVDDELELGRAHDRQVGRFLALEDAA